jgi:hypothetical protein
MCHEALAVNALLNFALLQEENVVVAKSCLNGSDPEAQHNEEFHQSSTLKKDLSPPLDHTVISTENEIQVDIFKQILIRSSSFFIKSITN